LIYPVNHFKTIQNWATELGFSDAGYARADFLEKEALHLEEWLSKGYHGQMKYMENWFDKRLDPRLLVEGAKSVIMLTFNYFPKEQQSPENPQIAKYAYGEDYHNVLKDKLKELLSRMQEEFGDINGRIFVDSAPVMERAWAAKSGLGWIGKHSLLIQKKRGSFFFLATIITDLEFEEQNSITTDHCGTCTRCIDACPTDAIVQAQVVDASKCISYLTIELKDSIPDDFKGKMENWAFGCDICQDVCPWNRFSKMQNEPRFEPNPQLLNMSNNDWQEITEDIFKEIFRKSAIKRTKFEGLKRNLKFITQ
jgi:epoxyqueuosine reductase